MSFAGPEKWIDTDDVFSRADCGSHRDFYPNIDIPRTFRHPQGIFSTFSYSSYPTISQILQLLDVADSNAGWGSAARGVRASCKRCGNLDYRVRIPFHYGLPIQRAEPNGFGF